MNLTPRLFLTKNPQPHTLSELVPLCREAVSHLFPDAVPVDAPGEKLASPTSFFLREASEFFWVEVLARSFTRVEICDYLAKARQIRQFFRSGICGLLLAPEFEPGVKDLLELIEFPIRCLRYQEAVPLGPRDQVHGLLRTAVLWIEAFDSLPSKHVSFAPPLETEKKEKPSPAEPPSSNQRLNREELREFIQLELDVIKP